MTLFYITGTSSGIGRDLAQLALQLGHMVIGLSRSNSLKHPNFKHLPLDLAKSEKLHDFEFNFKSDYSKIVLINNAGWLGEVKPFGKMDVKNFERTLAVNTLAPAILSNLFIKQSEELEAEKIIVNISSGAANYAIPSWSAYCASKAAMDMMTKAINVDHPEIHYWAIAPGVVDTAMQAEIRATDSNDFPDRQRFIDFKNQGDLTEPTLVASKIMSFIENPNTAPDSVFSLRNH